MVRVALVGGDHCVVGPAAHGSGIGNPRRIRSHRWPVCGSTTTDTTPTAAIAVARLAGIPAAASAEALAGFEGVHRRFEHRGDAGGAEFFDDYGQTPTEMEVTIETARRRAPRRLIALVQPHRYWRVRSLWRELGASVSRADLVVVTDVYGAAQDPIPGVTGKLVVDGVQLAAPGSRTVYLPHRSDVVTFLGREVREGDLVVTMGCGDVWMLGDAVRGRIDDRDRATGGSA